MGRLPKAWRFKINMTYQGRQSFALKNAKEDPIKALLAVEKELGFRFVVRNYKWDDYLYSKLPTSNVPKNVKNSEIINAILAESWETQGSNCLRYSSEPLASNKCYQVNGLLMYYFKSMKIADNMERIVGSLSRSHAFVHSFLKLGDHVIDNTFVLGHMEHWANKKESFELFNYMKPTKYNFGDPADPKYGVVPQSSEIGLKNVRLLYGQDEKVEQIFVQMAATLYQGLTLYDIQMRKFIKEKYGVEVESLAKKWSNLCWNCHVPNQDVKKNKCSKCGIARYCGKECQVQDWKVHKIVHAHLNRM